MVEQPKKILGQLRDVLRLKLLWAIASTIHTTAIAHKLAQHFSQIIPKYNILNLLDDL
jgi:hypothetical protein